MKEYRIEVKVCDFAHWAVIYKTSNSVDLIHTFNYLTKTNNVGYKYRCSIYLGGRWCVVNPQLISLFHVEH